MTNAILACTLQEQLRRTREALQSDPQRNPEIAYWGLSPLGTGVRGYEPLALR